MTKASDLMVGAVLRSNIGTATVVEIKSRTAKTITVKVVYDDAARLSNGNQASRINRYSLGTVLDTFPVCAECGNPGLDPAQSTLAGSTICQSCLDDYLAENSIGIGIDDHPRNSGEEMLGRQV